MGWAGALAVTAVTADTSLCPVLMPSIFLVCAGPESRPQNALHPSLHLRFGFLNTPTALFFVLPSSQPLQPHTSTGPGPISLVPSPAISEQSWLSRSILREC